MKISKILMSLVGLTHVFLMSVSLDQADSSKELENEKIVADVYEQILAKSEKQCNFGACRGNH
jgi:hypothetical protein